MNGCFTGLGVIEEAITVLFLGLAIFEVVKDRQKKEHFRHNKEDNKEDLPPFVYGDMITILGLNVNKGVIGSRVGISASLLIPAYFL